MALEVTSLPHLEGPLVPKLTSPNLSCRLLLLISMSFLGFSRQYTKRQAMKMSNRSAITAGAIISIGLEAIKLPPVSGGA